jgi:O-antigen/teichoic acid export membrane protein
VPLAVLAAGVSQALTLWHNRHARYSAIGRSRIAAPLAAALLQVGAGSAAIGLGGLIVGQVLGGLAGPLWLLWAQQRASGIRMLRWSRRQMWRVAGRYRQFPLISAPHAFVNGLQETMALGLLAAMAGPEAAGHFGVMSRVVKAPASLIGGALSEVLLGKLARMWNDGLDIRPMLRRAALALLVLAVPLGVCLVLVGPWLFEALLGPNWKAAGVYAQWLAPYLVGHFVIGPLTITPMVIGRQQTALWLSISGNAVYVAAIGLGVGVTGDVRAACGAISVALLIYFAIYWRWLMRSIGERRRDMMAALPTA